MDLYTVYHEQCVDRMRVNVVCSEGKQDPR